MVKAGFSIVLVVTFALRACAADGTEQGKPHGANALPIHAILEQVAKSPLGPGEARLLRALADLIEKEQDAGSQLSAAPSPAPAIASEPASTARQVPQPTPAEKAAATQQRLFIRLRHVPAADVAKAVQRFLDSFQKSQRSHEQISDSNRAIIVCEPVSNSLLISATPQMADDLTKLISQLDVSPPMVTVDVCIAELRPRSCEGNADRGASHPSATEKTPSMKKDGAAWLAWAKKQGRLEVLSRPQVMTLDNQPALIQIGTAMPIAVPAPGSDGPAKGPIKQPEVGLTVGLTPRISPNGLIFVDLDVERVSVVKRDGAVGPTLGKSTVQATVSATDGQTIVVGALTENAEEGHGPMIIALTPRVNPKR